MIKEIREKYNSEFSEEKYNSFVEDLNTACNCKIEFRIAETPIFIPSPLKEKIHNAINDIVSVIESDEYKKHIDNAIPPGQSVPNETEHSAMLAIDFAICTDENGELSPRLIELQGFPSLFFYQELLNQKFREHFNIPSHYENFFSGLNHDSYIDIMRETIVRDSDPENVILLEIDPYNQKTAIDFVCTEKELGIKPVCITEVTQKGSKLYYTKDGREIPIDRIYNRVIFDELLSKKDLKYNFRFRDELDVKWISHPNWFFKISKYSLPFFNSEYVPPTRFLSDIKEYPEDLENYILKPLFSFAGSGVQFDVTKEMLDAIEDKQNFVLQRKIEYTPVIQTPDIPAKAEIRILLVYKDGYIPVNNLVRLSKGKMMGVDFNKNKTWVGSSIAYFPE